MHTAPVEASKEPRTPPLGFVLRVVAALRAHGADAAVGGSGLLAALGLVDDVRDWDLTTDAETATVQSALNSIGVEYATAPSSDGPYGTRAHFTIAAPDHDVDVLVGFALREGDDYVQLPSRVTRTWHGLPMADPVVWLEAYRLLGRTQRVDVLQRWMDENG